MNKKLKQLKTAITLLELKQEYLSFTKEDKKELEQLKKEYNELAKLIKK